MRANHIVLVFPSADYLPCLLEIVKPVQIKTFIPEFSIETFNETILHGFSRINKHMLYMLPMSPCIEGITGKFGTIISFGPPWNSLALFRYLVTCCPVIDVGQYIPS